MKIEEVVLVDEKNNVLGTMPKAKVHKAKTLLHRGFSVFVFNQEGKLLLQQRSHKKKTWPLVWSNSCCGHPGLDESNIEAAKRRLKEELGFEVDNIKEIAPYRYSFVKDGVMENEICPVLVCLTPNKPKINKEEVETIKWIDWKEFLAEIKKNPEKYSPWCVEETEILGENKRFQNWFANLN